MFTAVWKRIQEVWVFGNLHLNVSYSLSGQNCIKLICLWRIVTAFTGKKRETFWSHEKCAFTKLWQVISQKLDQCIEMSCYRHLHHRPNIIASIQPYLTSDRLWFILSTVSLVAHLLSVPWTTSLLHHIVPHWLDVNVRPSLLLVQDLDVNSKSSNVMRVKIVKLASIKSAGLTLLPAATKLWPR